MFCSSLVSFLQVHIEQGPVLEQLGFPLGLVRGIAGQTRLKVCKVLPKMCISKFKERIWVPISMWAINFDMLGWFGYIAIDKVVEFFCSVCQSCYMGGSAARFAGLNLRTLMSTNPLSSKYFLYKHPTSLPLSLYANCLAAEISQPFRFDNMYDGPF